MPAAFSVFRLAAGAQSVKGESASVRETAISALLFPGERSGCYAACRLTVATCFAPYSAPWARSLGCSRGIVGRALISELIERI